MVCSKLRKYCTLKYFLQLLCTFLTLVLIFQELVNYTITKPTTVSSEEGVLDDETFPEITVCLDPGLNITDISELGYPETSSFYRGSSDGKKFVGWNGPREDKNGTKDFEDVMTMKLDQQYFKKVLFFYPTIGYSSAKPAYTHSMFPRGRCVTFSTSSTQLVIPERILLILNTSFPWPTLSENIKMRLYFADPVNSIKFYPMAFQMRGDPVKFSQKDLEKSPQAFLYNTKVLRSHHTKGDPRWDCTDYSKSNTYDSCVKREVAAMFEETLECVPPWYTDNKTNVCNRVYNMTDIEDKQLRTMFRQVYPKFQPKTCNKPCTETVFDTEFMSKSPSQDPVIQLIFHPVVSVTKSSFSISPQTLVGRLGGSVSSGRTLLWALLTGLAGDCLHRSVILTPFTTAINMLYKLSAACKDCCTKRQMPTDTTD